MILLICASTYHFLIAELPIFIAFLLLSVYLLVNGIQGIVGNRKDWVNYLSVGTGLFLGIGVVFELLF